MFLSVRDRVSNLTKFYEGDMCMQAAIEITEHLLTPLPPQLYACSLSVSFFHLF